MVALVCVDGYSAPDQGRRAKTAMAVAVFARLDARCQLTEYNALSEI